MSSRFLKGITGLKCETIGKRNNAGNNREGKYGTIRETKAIRRFAWD